MNVYHIFQTVDRWTRDSVVVAPNPTIARQLCGSTTAFETIREICPSEPSIVLTRTDRGSTKDPSGLIGLALLVMFLFGGGCGFYCGWHMAKIPQTLERLELYPR